MGSEKVRNFNPEKELQNYKFALNQHAIVATTDRSGRITYVNDKFCELSQYSRDQLLGQDHRLINSGYHSKGFFQEMYETIHAGKVWKGDIKNKAKDGTFYWVATTITPFKNAEGVINEFLAIRTNITENKRSEEQLSAQNLELLTAKHEQQVSLEEYQTINEELIQSNDELSKANDLLEKSEEALAISNSRLEIALNASNIGIWERNLANNESYRDETSFALYGIMDKNANISDEEWINYIHPDDKNKVIEAFNLAINKLENYEIEYRVVWADGSIHYLKAYGVVQQDSNGKPIRIIGAMLDVTDQKLSEMSLRESRERYKRDNQLLEESQAVAKLGGWELDLISGQLYWTAETYRIHDTSPEEFNPTVDAGVGYFLPESKKIISEALELAMTMGEGFDLYLETYTTKGRIIHVRTTCTVTMQDGKPIKLTGIFQDITEQKKAQQEIELSNSRLRIATDAAQIGIWEFFFENETLIWDDKMFDLYDVEKDAFSGTYEAWRAAVHPEDLEESERMLQNAIATSESFNNRFRIIWRDKSIHYIKALADIVRDEQGKAYKMIGVNYDITEQVERQNEIERFSTRLSLATQSANIGIWEQNIGDGSLIWDDQMLALHGISEESFNGSYERWRSLVHPDDIDQLEADIKEHIHEMKDYEGEYRVVWPDNSIHHIRSFGKMIRDDFGQLVKIIGTNYDVTDRVKQLIDIEQFSTRLSLATQSAKIGIWEFIIDDDILIWEDQTLALFGLTRETFSGNYQGWKSTVHPEDIEEAEQKIREAIANQTVLNIEFRTIWPDKTVRYIGAFGKPVVDNQDRTVKLIGTNYDVTERVERERELIKAKEKAEENDRLKSAFLANMRHEIRNPLNAIMGFSRQIAKSDISETERVEYASIVVNSSRQLLSIIDDITAISLLETKQEHVNKTDVNINELLSELELQFASQAKTLNLEFTLEKPISDEHAVIATDRSKLTRIITNLLTNALKFTHNGFVKFGYELNHGELIFFVEDSGIGISLDHHEQIFGSFQQADLSISRKYGGTGLGLTISQGLVEILGGKIWFDSELNKGSKFYVSLPINQSDFSIYEMSVAGRTGLRNTILIAEDQKFNFQYLKVIIQKRFKCEILHALNGEEAIELFKNNAAIAFVLMDINMPVMDGFDAASQIKKLDSKVPIIAQTGYEIEKNEKYSPGIFDGYISKPIDDELLLSKIIGYLSP